MASSCLICGGNSLLLDVVDFNKSCLELQGEFLPLSGFPVYYEMCERCHFVSSTTLFSWSDEEYLEKIYNDDYVKVDPEYLERRPAANAAALDSLFGASKRQLKVLDYGGGNGRLAELLRTAGWDCVSYDPFASESPEAKKLGCFDLITAFEVFEHVPDPNKLLASIGQFAHENTLILFTTELADEYLKPNQRINWWYCSPRNGHVSLYSKDSLRLLASKYQYICKSFGPSIHVLYKRMPAWALLRLGG